MMYFLFIMKDSYGGAGGALDFMGFFSSIEKAEATLPTQSDRKEKHAHVAHGEGNGLIIDWFYRYTYEAIDEYYGGFDERFADEWRWVKKSPLGNWQEMNEEGEQV